MTKTHSQLIAYGSDEEHFGVLRVPTTPPPHPIMVLIHGGMWRAMYDLDYFNPIASALTDAGIATWNIEYRRLGNGGGFPATFQDVARAVDHLRVLAPANHLNLERVAILGHSAGAALALWAAARARIPQKSALIDLAKNPIQMSAVFSLAGVVDLGAAAEHIGRQVIPQLLGGTRAKYPERFAATNPFEMLPLGVPQFLFHGNKDEDVPLAMSQDYFTAAKKCGDPITLVTQRNAGHFELVDPKTKEWNQVLKQIKNLPGF
jgi:acetyl esterase/lipase